MYFYNLTSKWKVYTVHKSANMLYLQNNVVYSFSLSRLLCAQRILRFYEKTEVPLLPNYLGIGFWPDDFLCQKFFRWFIIVRWYFLVSRYIVIIYRNPQRKSPERSLCSGYRDHGEWAWQEGIVNNTMKNKLNYTLTHEKNCPWLGVHFSTN